MVGAAPQPGSGALSDRAAKPVISVSMGDPGGIGPEVLVAALSDREIRTSARFRIHGSSAPMHSAAQTLSVEPFWWQASAGSQQHAASAHDVVLVDHGDADSALRSASKSGGELSFRYVEAAIAEAKSGEADAICTAPISKTAWSMAGRKNFPGHTELLASRFNAKRVAMLFESPKLRVVLASIHVPLMEIRNTMTIGSVYDAIDLGAEATRAILGREPRVAVCGLNPHAGEGGLLGDEETRLIEPAIRAAQEAGINAKGPFPGDTIFNAAAAGRYDLVVAMYHDQGLIPVKLLAWDQAVNVTCGLPVWRTSPDHGTAFDLVGTGKADAGSMKAALRLAVRLANAGEEAGSDQI